MPGRSATLTVKIVSDASKAAAGFADAESRVDKFHRGLDRASVAAGGLLVGMAGIAKGAFDAASTLQQSTGAIDSVFGDWAIDIEQAAQGAATALGLSTSAYEESAALIGSQLKNLGFPIDENVAKTQELIGVGADLAATFGGSTEDAVAALSSALKGERDPIEAYGVALSQAAVDAKVAAMGLDTSTDSAARNAAAQATLALITDQTAAAQGAFARESDTAAGAQARAAAQFENAQAALGEVLLPIVAAAMTKFSEFTSFLVENKNTVTVVAAVLAALAATVLAVNAAVTVYRTIATVATAAQWAWNVAMAANPVMLIVLGIAALVAGVVLAYQKFALFRTIVDAIGGALKAAFEGARAAITWVIDKLSFIGDAAGWVSDLFSAPQTMTVTPVAGASAAGLFGAAAGVPAVRGAALGSLTGGTSPSSGQGPASTVVNVTVNGAVDPLSTGRQVVDLIRRYQVATGAQVALAVSR